jgi:uncharacterized protein (TIGR02594 family)
MIPPSYSWLATEDGPKHMVEAIRWIGTKEVAGQKNNPLIMNWVRELGVGHVFTGDAVPWCGLFVAYCMKQAGRAYPVHFYRAKEWGTWEGLGLAGGGPKFGDVLVFMRDGGGHVGFYVGEDKTAFHVLGGNQGDSVSIVRLAKPRLIAIRRPKYFAAPANVRPIKLAGSGLLSTNEA